MKKTFSALLISASVLVFGPVAAGFEVTGFGVKTGVAMSNIFGRDVYDQKFRAGFSYGIFMTCGFGRTFAVQPELLFVMKGSKYVNGRGSDAYRETMSLEYVELPILAKVYLPLSRAFRTHVFAGPAPALNIRARVDARFAGETQVEALDNVMGVDIGLAAGAGIEVPVGGGRITFDVRYTAGLTTLSKEPDDDIRNGAVSFLFGYMF
ncbi:MAG TPA: porin family protein [Acidobacteriota bacterium]|nr:porin family protein [Acidobacteriota bacterium]